jgi:hypothetical protein
MPESKKHISWECTGFYWRTSIPERKKHVVKNLHQVTCGACKRGLLERIAALDWTDPNHLDVLARLEAALERVPSSGKGVTTKAKSKPSKKAPRAKGKLTWVCLPCFEDTALDEVDQFGYPRGTDIRKEHDTPRYCGTCGEDHGVKKVRVG